MPGYGISSSPAGLLEWSWADERLRGSHNYWVATASPSGQPHLAAVWGVWDGSAFWFSTGGRSRKARHLDANPLVAVAAEEAAESVVVHGRTVRVTDPAQLDAIRSTYVAKYGDAFPDPNDNPVYRVDADVVIGVIENEADFTTRATRWRFVR